jgi:hypothetical protein
MQPIREIRPDKCKQMKIKESKIAFICFYFLFRIEPFQRVTEEKIKKFPSVSARVAGCRRSATNRSSLPIRARAPTVLGGPPHRQHHSANFCLVQYKTD